MRALQPASPGGDRVRSRCSEFGFPATRMRLRVTKDAERLPAGDAVFHTTADGYIPFAPPGTLAGHLGGRHRRTPIYVQRAWTPNTPRHRPQLDAVIDSIRFSPLTTPSELTARQFARARTLRPRAANRRVPCLATDGARVDDRTSPAAPPGQRPDDPSGAEQRDGGLRGLVDGEDPAAGVHQL